MNLLVYDLVAQSMIAERVQAMETARLNAALVRAGAPGRPGVLLGLGQVLVWLGERLQGAAVRREPLPWLLPADPCRGCAN